MSGAAYNSGILLSGEELYKMAKQRESWDIGPKRTKYKLLNPEGVGVPLRDEDLDEPLDAIIDGLEMQVSEFLGRDYEVTRIENPITRSRTDWKSYKLKLRSDNHLLNYGARPATGERVKEPEDLQEVDTEIRIEGGEIGEQIWENTPSNMRPEQYDEEDSWASAVWTVS
ncbi:MAG: hypothetical protein BRC29_00660 [Nanohaloarchaea archaeon SW_7_43_1]|nr:MAG: hypothetical protein BRC29_00660 [Nanohaloarchaea archaeon SW_7_43_1]